MLYKIYKGNSEHDMSQQDQSNFKINEDSKGSFQDAIVDVNGKQVPLSSINKPHHVIIEPKDHQPNIEASLFPDIEPEAREREEKLKAERAKKKQE